MQILLVEDDEFKAADIAKILAESVPDAAIQRAMSVTAALKAITAGAFSFVILDMSLPTFDLSGPGGGGSPQSQGGLEVLRLARRLRSPAYFIILTQYPDIEIDGRDVPLPEAAKALRDRFQTDVRMCLLYEFDGDAWRRPLHDCLSALQTKVRRDTT